MARADKLIVHAGALLTMAPDEPTATNEPAVDGVTDNGDNVISDASVIEDGAVAVEDGRILETGTTETLASRYSNCSDVVDAKGRVVMPGFVDCHTHLVFTGTREAEMAARLNGASYLEILKAGGGINRTVSETRRASSSELDGSRMQAGFLLGRPTLPHSQHTWRQPAPASPCQALRQHGSGCRKSGTPCRDTSWEKSAHISNPTPAAPIARASAK